MRSKIKKALKKRKRGRRTRVPAAQEGGHPNMGEKLGIEVTEAEKRNTKKGGILGSQSSMKKTIFGFISKGNQQKKPLRKKNRKNKVGDTNM